jgi:hypothetical protein
MTYEKVLKFAEEAGFMNNSLGLTYTTGRLDECLKKFATLIEEGVLGDSKPVAWCSFDDTGHPNKFRLNSFNRASALYTHPAPAGQPLTDEQIDALQLPESGKGTIRDLVRIIEAAHGIGGSYE